MTILKTFLRRGRDSENQKSKSKNHRVINSEKRNRRRQSTRNKKRKTSCHKLASLLRKIPTKC